MCTTTSVSSFQNFRKWRISQVSIFKYIINNSKKIVKFQMLTETLADAEVDIKSLKNIVERKDDELSQSEEQCRHLVRHSDPKIDNSIRKTSHFRTPN
jgi:hypothetical protein